MLVPSGRALVLNLMRWGDEVRSMEGLDLPPEGTRSAKISAGEMKMAEQLVKDMTGPWEPDEFKDEFKRQVMKLVERKVEAGDTETVVEPEEQAPADGARILDLTELLARSLKGGKAAPSRPAAKPATRKAARKRPASKARRVA